MDMKKCNPALSVLYIKTKRRTLMIKLLIALLLAMLFARLFYIQVVGLPEFKEAASKQQLVEITGLNNRGIIYDRNLKPLVSEQNEYLYFVPKDKLDFDTAEKILNRLENSTADPAKNRPAKAATVGLQNSNAGLVAGKNNSATATAATTTAKPYSNVRSTVREVRTDPAGKYAIFAAETYDKETAEFMEDTYDCFIVETPRRYNTAQTAAHIIGYVRESDQCGASGLELLYDDLLRNSTKVFAYADVNGKLLPGLPLVTEKGMETEDLITTMDKEVQEKAEAILNARELNGAIIVLKTATGELIASASSPRYNPYAVRDYINQRGDELVNKSFQGQYPPGSVFKIVVAAAAIESGLQDLIFTCTGAEKILDTKIKCSSGGDEGHGEIGFHRAFALSCNSTFIQLGKLLGSEKILSVAERLGLGASPLPDIPTAKSGHLTSASEAAGAGIGNLSIGQGTLLVTPLQIARLTNIVANRGIDIPISIIKEAEGTVPSGAQRVLDENTALELSKLMSEVCDYGTGRGAKNSAGKTGSAESSQNGNPVVHGWFTGFFPCDSPKYTITVFVEDGKSGRGAALPVYIELMEYLTNMRE